VNRIVIKLDYKSIAELKEGSRLFFQKRVVFCQVEEK